MSGFNDNSLVKKAYQKHNYTEKEIIELALCMDPEDGPRFFMENFMYVQHPIKGSLKFTPYVFQLDLIKNYHNYRKSISLVSRQMGKALCLSTPILTPDGFKPLGDLEVGDEIYGSDGKKTSITFITETMLNHRCFEIEFSHGDKIVADIDHLWKIRIPFKNKQEIVTTEKLTEVFEKFKNTSQSISIDHTDAIEMENKPVPVDPYYLGLWLGDGGKTDLRITSTLDDYKNYSKVFEEKGMNLSSFTLGKGKNAHNVGTFYVKGGASGLKEAGVWNNKHIPSEYIFNSIDVRLELLRGLMDSDGTCEKTGVSRFYQSDKRIAEDIRFLLSTLGIKSTISVRKTTHKDSYHVVFATSKYRIFNLERKASRQKLLKNHPKNNRIYIKQIREVESVPVRCLTVDNNDHMFLAGQTLIPTHNSTVASGYLLWYAMFNPDSTVLIASKTHADAMEIMHRVRYAYESLPDHIRAGAKSFNKKSIEFDNGSRIISQATTENTGRGMSVSLLYVDELAFVSPRVAKEFWTSISPTLATGGKCIITSTPNTDEDQFADIWFQANNCRDEYGNETELGVNGFKSYFASWDKHPERDEDWAKNERASVGEDRFAREHLCLFIAFDELLINPAKLSKIKGKEPIRKSSNQVRWYKEPSEGHSYVAALDPAMGTGGDYSAIQVYELPTLEQVAEWQHNKSSIEQQLKILKDILTEIDEKANNPSIFWSVENNTLGEACLVVIREVGEESFPGMMIHDPQRVHGSRIRKGFTTTHKNKTEACAKLKSWVEQGRMTINSKNMISELKTFIAKGNSFEAKTGSTDDLVMSTILAIRMIQYVSQWDDSTYQQVNTTVEDLENAYSDIIMPMPFTLL